MANQSKSRPKMATFMDMTPFAGLETFNGKLLECYMRAGQSIYANAVKLNQEMMRFAGERFRADVKAMEAFALCKDWSQIASCQSKFAQSTAEAYQSEASKLTKLVTDGTAAALEPLEEASKAISKE